MVTIAPVGFAKKFCASSGMRGSASGKRDSKEFLHRLRRREFRKAVLPLEGKKQDAGKCAVNVGQSDQHVVATRPDVQRIRFEHVLPIRTGGNRQLLVPVIEILLGKLKRIAL